MERETPARFPNTDVSSNATGPVASSAAWRYWKELSILVLTVSITVGLIWWFRGSPGNGMGADNYDLKNYKRPELFQGWVKPDLAIVLSGQQFGYLRPCGCSQPQFGGLERRYNLMTYLRQKGWPLVAVDLGDIADKNSNPQRSLKYSTAMKALKTMGYSSVSVGLNEFNMPLLDALALHTLNQPEPRVLATNLLQRDANELFNTLVYGSRIVQEPGAPSVGAIGLIGPSIQTKINDPDAKFAKDNAKVLRNAMEEFKGKVNIAVLLYQGSVEEAQAAATYCAQLRENDKTLPNLDVILCLSPEAEPPANPTVVRGTRTMIVNIGHKGRFVGVVGAFRNATGGYDLRYQLVQIGPEWETPDDRMDGNPIVKMMIDYANEVKTGNYITKYRASPHPVQVAYPNAKYVGSQRCYGCHEDSFEKWEKSGHAHAYDTLVKVKHPPHRNHDGECVACHVVGFQHHTGYNDALRAGNAKMIERLKDVGCESCHGPSSEHVRDPENVAIRAAINPWGELVGETPQQKQKRLLKMDLFCQSCHDIDNDVHWDFEKKWPKVEHPMPNRKLRRTAAGVEPAQPPVQSQTQIPQTAPFGNPPATTYNQTFPNVPQQPGQNFIPGNDPTNPYRFGSMKTAPEESNRGLINRFTNGTRNGFVPGTPASENQGFFDRFRLFRRN